MIARAICGLQRTGNEREMTLFRSEFVVYHHQYIRTLVDFQFTKHATTNWYAISMSARKEGKQSGWREEQEVGWQRNGRCSGNPI